MQLLFAIVAYVLVQFAIGVWVSRRMTSANDYILAGRSLGHRAGRLLRVRHLLRRRGHRRLRRLGLREGLERRPGRSVRLRGSDHHRRPACLRRALWSRGLDHIRRSVPAALLARRRAAGRDRAAARLHHLGGRADPRLRAGDGRQLRHGPQERDRAGGRAGGRLLGGRRPARRRRHRRHPGHRRAGRARHPRRHRRAAGGRRPGRAGPGRARAARALRSRGGPARHAREDGDPDLRHHRCGGADLALPRRAVRRGRRDGPRWPAASSISRSAWCRCSSA